MLDLTKRFSAMLKQSSHGKMTGKFETAFFILIICMIITMYKFSQLDVFAGTTSTLKELFFQKQSKNQTLFDDELEKKKTILLWYTPFNDFSMITEFALENISKVSDDVYKMHSSLCGNCVITNNRSKLSNSDAIVFHATETKTTDLPGETTRRHDQLYVWWTQESSGLHRFPFGRTHFFNQTMTVRRSSGIYSPYNTLPNILKILWSKEKGNHALKRIVDHKHVHLTDSLYLQNVIKNLPVSSLTTTFSEIPSTIPLEIHELLTKKNRKVTWIVSNCGVRRRFDYFNKLKAAGLKIDLFGNCGQKFPIKSRWDPAFYEVLSRYKFYLAFENSYHCEDYFTEKVWHNSLISGVVPIILGPHKDDISSVLPPKSYIHTEDFETPQLLVNYLNYLDQNVTAYSEYLEWRSWIKYLDENGDFNPQNIQNNTIHNLKLSKQTSQLLNRFATKRPAGFCSLCRTIHKSSQATNLIPNVSEWYAQDRPECLNG